ncbi:metal ABC transporter solute-binding protein, Zn/Mn family [Roseococcus sp. DSY-14]|uniref:metal ABC transporter solute-binding protein, Zn/Mn family n=1 Tax=Roseococcus sp. DSY-14 TaxID=3369650 RepID=UPI00387B6E3C
MLARRALPLLALPAAAQGRPVAVASFTILGDLARQVAGEGWEVRVLAGPEADPHAFQPRPSDAALLRGAQLAIRNGAGFDAWFDRLLRGAGFRGRLVTATEGLPLLRAAPGGHSHGAVDPHGWQDARLAMGYARTIAAAMAADPAPLLARMAAVDRDIRAALDPIPAARRVVVTAHDAFAHYGAAYGVRFLAPAGLSSQSEPSAQQVAALIRQIRAERIRAVFLDNVSNPATLRRLAEEAGVAIRGRLHADTLSPPGGPAPTWEAMMRHNTALLADAMADGAG